MPVKHNAQSAVVLCVLLKEPRIVVELVEALTALGPTEAERAEARAAVVAVLPTADPNQVGDLVAALRHVSTVQSWLAWLAKNE
jgi:hypothetical protein